MAAASSAAVASAASAATILAPWVEGVAARVGTAGVVGVRPADDFRLAAPGAAVPKAQSQLVRLRLAKPLLRDAAPAALSDWLLDVVEQQPAVQLWRVDLAPSDAVHCPAPVRPMKTSSLFPLCGGLISIPLSNFYCVTLLSVEIKKPTLSCMDPPTVLDPPKRSSGPLYTDPMQRKHPPRNKPR